MKTNRVILKILFVSVVLVGLLNVADYIYASVSANAATSSITASATINPSATITISGGNQANIVPSSSGTIGKTSKTTVSMYTNTTNTCTTTIKSKTSQTNLVSADTDTPIPTLSSATTQAAFPNDRWGYQIGTTDSYKPITTSGATIKTTTSNTGSTASTVDIYYAAKLTAATKPGVYTNTVTLTATCASS